MVIAYIIVGIFALIIAIFIGVVIVNEKQDKKVIKLMEPKGIVLALTKENLNERKAIIEQLTVPVRAYVNGPDQTSVLPRRDVTFQQFVKLNGGGLLFNIWVGNGTLRSGGTRSDSTVYVVEYIDGKITHFVKGSDYVNNAGSFDGIPNAVFKIPDPSKYSGLNKFLKPLFDTMSNMLKIPREK